MIPAHGWGLVNMGCPLVGRPRRDENSHMGTDQDLTFPMGTDEDRISPTRAKLPLVIWGPNGILN